MKGLRSAAALGLLALLLVGSVAANAVCLMGSSCPMRPAPLAGGHACCGSSQDAPAPAGEAPAAPVPESPACPASGDCCSLSVVVPGPDPSASLSPVPGTAVAAAIGVEPRPRVPRPAADLLPSVSVAEARSGPIYLLDVSFLN